MEYPNIYYKQLAERIVRNPLLFLNDGEVCFYEGVARTFKTMISRKKEKPKNKFGFFWTPWFWGISRKKIRQITTTKRKEYYTGTFYITNMRLTFKS